MSRTAWVVTALVPVALLLAGCDDGGDTTAGTGGSAEPTSTPSGAGTELSVTVRVDGGEPTVWTLTCDPAGGTHPDPEGACARLAEDPEALDPLPFDVICTEIYGGPQTATVVGTLAGRPVNAELSRTNGCEIDRWDRLLPVLVEPGGVDG
ncbi:MAG TPA: SSI family serine proteinase inhibitor [Jiangellales bacterium]|nr:SSI family serine proteinase inhibitor [Jiangellales bacterium]